ncbi:MAG: ATP-binding cassette domain-containing protein [Micrococcales bacterium]|nr:ATP-binding cassette domain-containing protein [Micrococcales bacterium]
MTSPIITLTDVSKTFKGKTGPIRAVDRVSLEIEAGEVFGVIGHSGAGKSTLVRLINALESVDPGSGGLTVAGHQVPGLGERDLRALRSQIGMIFQGFNLLSAKTVAVNVGYPLKLAGWSQAARAARVSELLEFTGIADKADSYPSQLSGGQKQRVGIARALAARPSILLADEATSALDPETTRDVLDLLVRANRELGVTIVLITHVMSVVQYLCGRTAVMEEGRVVESGRTYDVFSRPKAAVTRKFVQTALHDRPTPATIKRLRARHPGRLAIVTVASDGGLALGALEAAAIVYGSLTEVEGRPFGSITLELTGDDDVTSAALGRLRSAGLEVVDLGTAADPLGGAL